MDVGGGCYMFGQFAFVGVVERGEPDGAVVDGVFAVPLVAA
jgi:hypothetical protein